MEVTLAFLLVALAAYAVFGGADFGGGVLEATLWRHDALRHRLQATLAPVWEANHVWLIAVIVILFVGFPAFYAALCTTMYVPLSLALIGIILRGAFFTFRKYDPNPGARLGYYNALFRLSSAIVPMMFGFIVAALLVPLPRVTASTAGDFFTLYIAPWTTVMGALCATFVFALFSYVSAVFFYGELDDAGDRAIVARRIGWFFAATFATGGAALGYGAISGRVPVDAVWRPVVSAAQVVAFASIAWLWWSLRRNRRWQMRLAAGTQVMAILAGWFATQYPALMHFADGSILTAAASAAPAATLGWLNAGLVVVILLVVPPLVYLYRVFGRAAGLPGDRVIRS